MAEAPPDMTETPKRRIAPSATNPTSLHAQSGFPAERRQVTIDRRLGSLEAPERFPNAQPGRSAKLANVYLGSGLARLEGFSRKGLNLQEPSFSGGAK
jgi:hypothetical protein